MAFRIHESVVRGEIDNRVKGVVRGKIWVEGRADPVTLDLNGNAWPDLVAAGIIALLFLHSAWEIIRDALAELRERRDA